MDKEGNKDKLTKVNIKESYITATSPNLQDTDIQEVSKLTKESTKNCKRKLRSRNRRETTIKKTINRKDQLHRSCFVMI